MEPQRSPVRRDVAGPSTQNGEADPKPALWNDKQQQQQQQQRWPSLRMSTMVRILMSSLVVGLFFFVFSGSSSGSKILCASVSVSTSPPAQYQQSLTVRQPGAIQQECSDNSDMDSSLYPCIQSPSSSSSVAAAAGTEAGSILVKRRRRRRRRLEDAADQQQNDNNNDDQQQQRGGPGNDDFFDDFIQDDLIGSDNGGSKIYDPYYDYEYTEKSRLIPLWPLQTTTIVGYFVAALALGLGASSGTGGGGTIVPIYILIVGLPIQVAIPIGAVTVLGGALASTCFNWTRRHPLADRVLIDWDLVLVMEPLTLVGTLLGTLLHRVVSVKILMVILVLLLSITAYTTLTKAMRMYQAEVKYIRHLRAATQSSSTAEHIGMSPSSISKSDTFVSESEHLADRPPSGSKRERQLDAAEKQAILILNPDFVTLRSELMEQEKFTPRSKIIALCIMFSVVIFLNIMVGGGAYASPWDIDCGSVAFWVIHVIMIAFLIASAWAAHSYVVARFEIKQLVRFDYVHGDIKWDTRSAIIYPAVFMVSGLFAGTLGIGGGIITVPIMLAMGVHPGVVSATSSTMILFTTFASSISYFVFDLVLTDFALVGFLVGVCAASIGQILMRQARQARSASGRDFERNSYTAFAIGGVILISALLMTIEYVFAIVEQPDDEGGLCDGLRF